MSMPNRHCLKHELHLGTDACLLSEVHDRYISRCRIVWDGQSVSCDEDVIDKNF